MRKLPIFFSSPMVQCCDAVFKAESSVREIGHRSSFRQRQGHGGVSIHERHRHTCVDGACSARNSIDRPSHGVTPVRKLVRQAHLNLEIAMGDHHSYTPLLNASMVRAIIKGRKEG